MAHDVFISYSTQSKPTADAVCQALEGRGVPCWMAPRDIRPGIEWAEGIIQGIEGSRIVVLILCEMSNDSPQVLREVERAVSKRIPIIPFRIDNVTLSKSMEYFVSSHHWLDASVPPLEPHLRALGDSIEGFLKSKSGEEAAREKGSGPVPRVVPAAPPKETKRLPLAWLAVALVLIAAVLGYVFYPRTPEPVVKTEVPATQTEPAKPPAAQPQPEQGGVSAWSDLANLVSQASYQVEVSTNQEGYHIGDPLIITVKVNKSGYLNVFTMSESDGAVTVLFPNAYHTDNYVEAGAVVTIPAEGDDFELKAQAPAGKSLVAVFHTEHYVNAYKDGTGSATDLFKTMPQKKIATRGFVVKPGGAFGSGMLVTTIEE